MYIVKKKTRNSPLEFTLQTLSSFTLALVIRALALVIHELELSLLLRYQYNPVARRFKRIATRFKKTTSLFILEGRAFALVSPTNFYCYHKSLPLVKTPLTVSSCSQALLSSFFIFSSVSFFGFPFSSFTVVGFVERINVDSPPLLFSLWVSSILSKLSLLSHRSPCPLVTI